MPDSLNEKDIQEINRRYRLSYFIIPIPMILGIVFASYIYLTKDSRVTCYCTVAKESQSYAGQPLQERSFEQHTKMTLSECRQLDDSIDDDDGRSNGRVRWFVCTGMSCGPGWQRILSEIK